MNEDFAHPAWAEMHEKLAAGVAAGLARLARWLRRRAKAKDETPAITPHHGESLPPQRRAPPADAQQISAKTAAPNASGASSQRRD